MESWYRLDVGFWNSLLIFSGWLSYLLVILIVGCCSSWSLLN